MGSRRQKNTDSFLRRGNSDKHNVWKEYVGSKDSLEHGLKTIYLDSLFDREIYDVGPISHLNAGMLTADLALLKGLRNRYMYMMGYYSRAQDNVVMLTGDSRYYDFASLRRKFDIIFINSGHGYDRVLDNTRKTFEYLTHDDSVVVWHDYSYFPEEIRYEVLAGILDGTDTAHREQLFFVSKTKCAIFLKENLLKKIPSK